MGSSAINLTVLFEYITERLLIQKHRSTYNTQYKVKGNSGNVKRNKLFLIRFF